ncbi:MAG: type IV secretory system conjugative DNA transfer family protein [Pseudomonadota bacterium]
MGTGMFRIIMVLLWTLGGLIVAFGLFNGDYALVLVGGVCFIIPLFLPMVVILINRIPQSRPKKPVKSPAQIARQRAEGQWAKAEDLDGRKMFDAKPSVILGRWGTEKKALGAVACSRLMTFGNNTDDYYRSAAVPNALLHPGNLFVYERSGAIFRAIRERREKMGQHVFVIDPFGQTGSTASTFNPLEFIRHQGEGLVADAGMIADLLLAPSYVSDLDTHEARTARTLLQGFIIFTVQKALTENRNLAEVRRNLVMQSHRFYKILEELMNIETADGRISEIALTILDMTEDQRMSIVNACRAATAIFDNPAIARSISSSSFAPNALLEKPVSLFIIGHSSEEEAGTLAAFGRVLLGTMLSVIEKRSFKSGDPDYLVLLDGIEELGRLPMFERMLGGALTDGITVWTCLSGVSGLMDVCHNWENIVGRSDVIQVFGQDGAFDLDWVAGLTAMSRFEDTGGAGADRNSPVHLRPRDNQPILKSTEVARFPSEEQILFRKGVPPIRAWRIDWYHDEIFRGMAVHAPTFN